ncbi:rhodanese-like domain-containing protein [Pseudocolwellia sp. AS88]|uniref:rhodanese-like domain-containing protein n=1 Tax=Pseudocolwellia sp. AS88 TaxID=3063958 RepID=UPI0026EC20B2|nr:rhodanese-like domain-containing protein [Pseudocolwellia sp. AS88]MDO7085664.1 rhodanese-like domain-containing protein [Pseudocolwellia sp. AS88]
MKFENVTPTKAKQWLENGEAILIDVREPAEFATKHIQGATLLPLGKITSEDLPETNKKIVIYCQKGSRGNSACVKITDQNSSVVIYNLVGGIEAWQEAGNAVKEGKSKVLPLDRQVQITIGSLALASSLTGYFHDPAFMLLPAFLGAGLLFAGLSGTCGLAILMAKMPWNQKV